MKQSRDTAEEKLIKILKDVKIDKDKTNKMKEVFRKNKITVGQTQKFINEPASVMKYLDEKTFCVYLYLTHKALPYDDIDPNKYYTERQIKEAISTFEPEKRKEISFPITLNNVIKIADDNYFTKLKATTIKEWFDNGLIQYNFESQREPRYRRDQSGSLIPEPKIYKESVEQIAELFIKGELISSVLTFNARLGTSDEGQELIYDEDEMTLTITKGTLLDSLDGFHRINGIVNALTTHPDANDMYFKVDILNYHVTQAREYFAQMNTVNHVSKSRIKEYKQSDHENFVADQLMKNSELKGKVVSSDRISPRSNELITFSQLSTAIKEYFGKELENRSDAIKIFQLLQEFFQELFFAYPDEFLGDVAKIREKSIINTSTAIMAFVALAKEMRDKNISYKKVKDLLNSVDFSRDNEEWKKLKILDEQRSITNRAYKKLAGFFKELVVKGGVDSK